MPARWRLVTPQTPGASAAIGVFHITGDVDRAMAALGMKPIGMGGVSLRRFADIDRGVAARPTRDTLLLMPHAGPAVIRRLEAWLTSHAIKRDDRDDPRTLYPEAATLTEARMLHALARAASPLAIDLLLDQPRRWDAAGPGAENDPEVLARSAILSRLIDPPTIVAFGPPNIGKSTLLNTLAGRSVAIVADEPGTTRDHVGVRLDLAGLVVNYIDTPGINAGGAPDQVQRDAQELAQAAAANADLLLLCADPTAAFIGPPSSAKEIVRAGLRADTGDIPGADLAVSARTGAGIEPLVAYFRARLLTPAALTHPGPWQFW